MILRKLPASLPPRYLSRPPPRPIRALQYWLTFYRHTFTSTVWSGALTPLLFLSALGYGLGHFVDERAASAFGSASYVAFVAPAILAINAMSTALNEATFPVFAALKWNKSYIGAQATSLRPADIFRGHLLFIGMRVLVNAAIYVTAILLSGAEKSAWVIADVPVAVLIGVAFAAPTAAWSMTVKSDNSFSYMFRFVMTPLMLFSGTFFSLTELPGWFYPVIYATPLWHGVALCRALSLGTISPCSLMINLSYLVGLAVIGLWAGARTYRGRLYV